MLAGSCRCQRTGTQAKEGEPTEGGQQRDEREAITNFAHSYLLVLLLFRFLAPCQRKGCALSEWSLVSDHMSKYIVVVQTEKLHFEDVQ